MIALRADMDCLPIKVINVLILVYFLFFPSLFVEKYSNAS